MFQNKLTISVHHALGHTKVRVMELMKCRGVTGGLQHGAVQRLVSNAHLVTLQPLRE